MSWLSAALHGDPKAILKLGGTAALAFLGAPELAGMFNGGATGGGFFGGIPSDILGGVTSDGGEGGGGGGGLLAMLGHLFRNGDGGINWDGLQTLLGGANAIYGAHEAHKPPKFYQAPMTPAEQWALDARKQLFNYDPVRDYVGQYAHQFMNGTANLNPSFTLHNSKYGDSPFMGGVKVPTFDPSAFPTVGGQQPQKAANTPTPGQTPGQPQQQPNASPLQDGSFAGNQSTMRPDIKSYLQSYLQNGGAYPSQYGQAFS